MTIKFVNVHNTHDVVWWDSVKGVFTWEGRHTDGLKRYLGEHNGEKAEFFWENQSLTPYWGW